MAYILRPYFVNLQFSYKAYVFLLAYSLSFNYTLCWPTISTLWQIFMFMITGSDFLAQIKWSVWNLNFISLLCKTIFGFYIYYCFILPNAIRLHNSKWITFPTQSYLFSRSFQGILLQSPLLWLVVSALSVQGLHLLFWCVISIWDLI